jgi:hypothetical protein
MWHRLIRHVQGNTGSQWMLPSGDYSLCIAGCQGNNQQTTVQNIPTLLAVSMAIGMRRYDTERIA